MTNWELDERENAMPIVSALLSRRQLLRRAAVIGLTMPAISGLLAACGDDDDVADDESADAAAPVDSDDEADDSDQEPVDEPDDEDTEDEQPAADDRRGGQLRIGWAGSADNFDPHHNLTESVWVTSHLYSRLIGIDPDMELVPELALAWESSDDGSTWTLQIREGVKFHDGKDLTTEDVQRSFERLIDPDEGSQFTGQIDMIESVEAVSENEVAMHLSTVYADLPMVLCNYFARVVDVDAADSLATEPNGTGPFKMSSHSPGERTVLERFDDYFDLENQGFVDEIHFITIAEESTQVTSLTTGSIDLLFEVTPSILPTIENDPNIVIEEVPSGTHHVFCMHCQEEPFTDVRVRQAVKLVVDREEMIEAAFQGHGEPAADHPIAPFDPMDAGLPIPQRDVERARELLDEAGYPDGLDLELHYTTGQGGFQAGALTLQEQAADAGINIEVVNHPSDAYWADIWMQRPFVMSYWAGRPLADTSLTVAYLTDAGWNETFWSNERFDELVALARETLDEDERREMYREAQEILATDGGALIPFFTSVISAWSSRVHGYRVHPLRFFEVHSAYLREE